MKPTSDYATAPAQMGGEREQIPVGGHVCKILSAKCEQSKNGNDMLVLAFDISEGSASDGFYKRNHERRKGFSPDAKWAGIYRSTVTKTDGTTNPMFKGLITAIEKSNSGYNWDWDEGKLKGKFVGFNFGPEEFLTTQGEVRTNVRPRFPATVEDVREGKCPILALKKLEGNTHMRVGGVQLTPVSELDDDLPF